MAQAHDLTVGQAPGEDQQPVSVVFVQRQRRIGARIAVLAREMDQKVEPGLLYPLFDAAQQRHEKLARDLRHQQTDCVGAASGQSACGSQWLVVELLHGIAHLGHGLPRDRRSAVEHAADGRNRHAGQLGHIVDRHTSHDGATCWFKR